MTSHPGTISRMFNLSGKTAVVTGAGSGIGRAIATLFAQAGAAVEILDFDEAKAIEAASGIAGEAGAAAAQKCDVGHQDQVRACIDQVMQRRGRIHILVNNAGIAHIGNLEATSEADLDRLYQVNVKGVYNCLHAVVPAMAAAGGGVVLNMASVASLLGIRDRFAYSMTKGAVLTMTYSVAADYVDKGVRCNCICPARVHTPFVDGYLAQHYPGRESEVFDKLSKWQPIGRMATPPEIAALALYLCSDEASFITGAAYPIDGGVMTIR